MRVCDPTSVCVCVCKGLCACVCVFVALSREIKSGITISRSIAWVIEPHSRELCHKSNRFPKGAFLRVFFPATGKITTTASALASSQPYRAAGATVQAAR